MEEEVWSDWETKEFASYHSQFYRGCVYETRRTYRSHKNQELFVQREYRILLPKRVKVSELTGTVQIKNGKPDFSTYQEELMTASERIKSVPEGPTLVDVVSSETWGDSDLSQIEAGS